MLVKKLITVSQEVWNGEIAPILKVHGFLAPVSNFDFFKYINISKFVEHCNDKLFLKLLSECFKRAGIIIEMEGDNLRIKSNDYELLKKVAIRESGIKIHDVQSEQDLKSEKDLQSEQDLKSEKMNL